MAEPICSIAGCDHIVRARSLCATHYAYGRKHGWFHIKREPGEKFWSKVPVDVGPDDCWEWQGVRNALGYGYTSARGRRERAHRVAWELVRGPIPAGMEVCHHCDNPPCVNTGHLFIGTHRENMLDKSRKGRDASPKGSANGKAKLTPERVRLARELLGNGLSHRAVAARLGVSRGAIWAVANGITWGHVQ